MQIAQVQHFSSVSDYEFSALRACIFVYIYFEFFFRPTILAVK